MPRLFYGISMPDAVKAEIARVQRGFQQDSVRAGNWSNPNLFHITVVFLGEVPTELQGTLDEIGEAAAKSSGPFQLCFQDVGMFERNRILWLGLKQDEGYRQLQELQQAVQTLVAEQTDVRIESRPYRPHLTLARKLDVGSYRQVAVGQGDADVASFGVHELCLFESTRIDGVLTYPVRRKYPLGTR